MKKQDRNERILEELNIRKKLSTEQVTDMLGISESSTRRIFLELEKAGKVVRTFGGIHLAQPANASYRFEDFESKNLEQKRQIAAYSCSLIEEDDIVYFDSGTTILQLAIAVRQKLNSRLLSHIRVITNSFANLQVLHESCEVILIGGQYRPGRKDFAGYAAERFVQNFNYKKSFLGADGFDISEGYMATDTNTAKLNEIIYKRSEQCFALLDSSKLGVRSFVSYADISDIKTIITDANINPDMELMCAQAGLSVLNTK